MPKYTWEGQFGFPVKLPGRIVPLRVPLKGGIGEIHEIPLAVDVGAWELLDPPAPHGRVRVTLTIEKLDE